VSRFETRAGSVVLTERSRALPVVGIGVSLRKGTLYDPEGQEGLTVLTSRALRMGPKRLSSRALEDTLDGLGAQLGISASQSYVHVGGVVVAKNVEDLHSEHNNINKQTALTEKGEVVGSSGDPVNMHDMLTGSDPAGMYSTAGGDTTCGNWTKSGEGSAIVGHHNRGGLKKETRHMTSWNSSHGSRGCSQDNLKATGGAGLFYCFAAN